ncbi:hypothetical protein [Haloflavibacter putidus]|uniref:Uncharacterized protein n=1 Tax=Haloflavibacter putidus TaxID=2576776 RepID=A0A507ZUU2_9FLAO|nr:hypothetical protein [Haloflavibacter putidus]TQD40243.1 hypothetical protein FKR84_03325 [Haloflavibacter putidus]
MSAVAKNIIGILLGIFVGGLVNMSLVLISASLITETAGFDITGASGLQTIPDLYESPQFLLPLLAHVLGTFIATLLSVLIAEDNLFKVSFITVLFFFGGGIVNAISVPAPTWFIGLDLVVAYFPAGYLGYLLGKKRNKNV